MQDKKWKVSILETKRRYKWNICELLSYTYIFLYPIAPAFFKILGLDSGVILSIVFGVLYFFFRPKYVSKIKKEPARVIFISLVLICIPCLVHSDASRVLRYVFEYGIVIICLMDFFRKEERWETAFNILVLTACIMCVCGTFEFIFGRNLFEGLYNDFSGTTMGPELQSRGVFFRSETTFGHSIPYGIYLSFCGLIAYYLFSITRKKKYIYCYAFILLNLFMTLSRAPILFFFLSQFVFLWILGKHRFLKYVLRGTLLTILLVFVVWLINPTVFDSIMKMLYIVLSVFSENAVQQVGAFNNSNAFSYRLELFSVLPKLVEGNWIFGLGRNSGTTFTIGGFIQRSIDNAWLCFILNYGIVGTIGYLIMVLYPGLSCRRSIKESTVAALIVCLTVNYFLNLWSVAMMTENRTWVILYAISLAGIGKISEKRELSSNTNVGTLV